MKAVFASLCVLLLAFPAWAGWGSLREGGGDAAMFEFCEDGGKGIGYDATTGKYEATCANYNWSGDAEETFSGAPECTDRYVDCTAANTCNGSGNDCDSCLFSGERLKAACVMHDITYACDKVKRGGKVYLPDDALHPFEGCGDGDATACPIVNQDNDRPEENASYDSHYIEITGQCQLVGEGLDADAERNGRTGSWIIGNAGNDGTTDVSPTGSGNFDLQTTVGLGPHSSATRTCAGVTCDFDANVGVSGSPGGLWGNTITLLADFGEDDGSSLGAVMCVETDVANTGVCSLDKRITCTTATEATKCTTPGKGTCLGMGAAIADELDDGFDVYVEIDYFGQDNVGVSTAQNVQSAVFKVIEHAVTNCSGGNSDQIFVGFRGVDGSESRFLGPSAFPRIDKDDIQNMYVLDHERVFMPPGFTAITGVNFMPSSWYGRDDDGDTVSEGVDCLSGGDSDTADDEAACDTNSMIEIRAHRGVVLESVGIHRGSVAARSSLDSGGNSEFTLRDMAVYGHARAQWCDCAAQNISGLVVRDSWFADSSLLSVLRAGVHWRDIECFNSYGNALINGKSQGNALIEDITTHQCSFKRAVVQDSFYNTTFRNWQLFGGWGRIYLYGGNGDWPPHGLRFENIVSDGGIFGPDDLTGTGWSGRANSAFEFSDAQSGGEISARDIVIQDCRILTQDPNSCFLFLNEDGVNDFVDYGNEFQLLNNSIYQQTGDNSECTAADTPWPCCTGVGAGDCETWEWVCVGDHNTAGGNQAEDTADVLAEQFIPRMSGNRLYTVDAAGTDLEEKFSADWPFASIQRDANVVLDAASLTNGYEVAIYDDSSDGACAHTSGTLDGGGTGKSVCVASETNDSWASKSATASSPLYGEMHQNAQAGACNTVDIVTQNTFVEVDGFSAGSLSGITCATDCAADEMVVPTGGDGDYHAVVSISFEGEASSIYEFCVAVDGTADSNCCTQRDIGVGGANSVGAAAINCVLPLTATDTVSVLVTDETTPAQDVAVCDMNIAITEMP